MKKAHGVLIFSGYFFSIAGGLIGVPIALILIEKYDEEARNHGRIMLITALTSVTSFSIILDYFLVTLLNEIFVAYILTYAIIGGAAAYIKKDFFSRGFCISMLTGIFGSAVLLLSPTSKAREGDENDYHSWPEQGGLAPILFIGLLIFLSISKKIFVP